MILGGRHKSDMEGVGIVPTRYFFHLNSNNFSEKQTKVLSLGLQNTMHVDDNGNSFGGQMDFFFVLF